MEETRREDLQPGQSEPKKRAPQPPRKLLICFNLITAAIWLAACIVETSAAAAYYKIVYVYGAVVPELAKKFTTIFWLNASLALLFFLFAAWFSMVGIALWQRRRRLLAQTQD